MSEPTPAPGAFLIRGSTLRSLVDGIRRLTPLPVSGLDLVRTSGGFTWLSPGSQRAPFALVPLGDRLAVQPGLINGLSPTIGGTPLESAERPTLHLPAGTVWPAIRIEADLAFSGGTLASAAFTSASIVIRSQPPSHADVCAGDSPFHIVLGRIVDRVVTAQYQVANLSVDFVDASLLDTPRALMLTTEFRAFIFGAPAPE